MADDPIERLRRRLDLQSGPKNDLPRALPVKEEQTRTDGVFEPSPGSVGPYKRSLSPAPAELAPDPESVRAAHREAREAVRAQEAKERAEVAAVQAVAAPAARTIDYKGIAAVIAALGGLGLGGWAKVEQANPKDPPPVAIPCQQRCPLGNAQPIPPGLAPLELQATMQCCEIMTSRLQAAEALAEAKNARELAGKASDKATKVETETPKVNP